MFGNQLTFFSSIALSRKSRSQLDSGVSFILQSLQWPHLDFDYLIQNCAATAPTGMRSPSMFSELYPGSAYDMP